MPVPANPNIEQVLQEFLAVQKRRLKPATFSKYESVMDLLLSGLNGYAYEDLSRNESSFSEKHYNAEGKEHREFCQLFGPVVSGGVKGPALLLVELSRSRRPR